jgi:acyl-CoA synthetase (NDP forming)
MAAFLVPEAPEAASYLASAGVPTFTSPEVCADIIAAAAARREPRAALTAPTSSGAITDSTPRPLDEVDAYELVAGVGVAAAPYVELDVDAPSWALPFGFPVAVKVLDKLIAHKTDVGGVVLGVRDSESLRDAVTVIAASVALRRPDRPLHRVLVQPMTAGIGQVLVGYRRDAQVGPLIVLAAGGTLTELYRDRSVRLAPVDTETARGMLDDVVGIRQLRGFRGAPEADLDALVATIVGLSKLAHDPRVIEAEINPVVVKKRGEGAVAIDAVAVVHGDGST